MTDAEIVEALATKVMGWTARGDEWVNSYGHGEKVRHHSPNWDDDPWNPLTEPSDSKEVREKLAERYWYRMLSPFSPGREFHFGVTPHSTTGWNGRPDIEASAWSEEMAVALCALKTVGVEL